jgi:hypothetical protein
MPNRLYQLLFSGALLLALSCPGFLAGQEQPSTASIESAASATTATVPTGNFVLPAGTRLPLMLQAGITTRTAKPGDAVYFQTTFPIAQDNRVVIPMGTFVRGELISVNAQAGCRVAANSKCASTR